MRDDVDTWNDPGEAIQSGEGWRHIRILITGGNGYVGSELGRLLATRGDVVCCYDQRWDNFYKGGHYVGDIRDQDRFAAAFEEFHPDVVVHLTAVVGAPACERDPVSSTLINVGGALVVSRTVGRICPVVLSSSDSVYGPQSDSMVTENTPPHPASLYAVQKHLAEQLLLLHNDTVVLRLVTGYGVSINMRHDLLFHTLVKDGVEGKAIMVSEPEAVRSFVHVTDMASAFRFAVDDADKMAGHVYNVGSPSAQLTKLDFARLVASKTGVPCEVADTRWRDADKRDCVLSFEKVHALGWSPRVTIGEGIDELVRYYAAGAAKR